MDTKRRHGESREVKKSVRSTFDPKTGRRVYDVTVRGKCKVYIPPGFSCVFPISGSTRCILNPHLARIDTYRPGLGKDIPHL